MNELSKIEKAELPILPIKSIEIYNQLSTKFVKDEENSDLFFSIGKLISITYATAGFKIPDENDLGFITKEVVLEIKRSLPSLRVGEIEIAFKRGVLKEYGEYMGLSVVSFISFAKSYYIDQNRMEALAEKNKPKYQIKEPSQEEKFNTAKGNAIRALGDVKTGRDISLYASVVYDFLDGLKLIEFDIDEKKNFFNIAREQLIKESEIKKVGTTDIISLRKMNQFLDSIRKGAEANVIAIRAKKLAMVVFLEGIIFEETDLDDLIETKKAEYLIYKNGLENEK